MIPGGSAKEKPSRAWGEGEGGEARSVVFYEGLRLWGCSGSRASVRWSGSAKEDPHVRGGRVRGRGELGSYEFK